MLQQTQAARVVPYYERFLDRFPDPAACARAPAAEVLRAWSGLGYNRRALALRRAAAMVAAEGWPRDLTVLPGVGPYTAAAVASFAFDAAVLAVDTNVRRVLARCGMAVREPTPELNQALMELGATVCTARAPRCGGCPIAAACPGPEAPPAPRAGRPRFEDTDRWVRGRIVAALAAGRALPDVPAPRLHHALDGLERDGLIERDRVSTPSASGRWSRHSVLGGARVRLPGDALP
jgi:A/G-specific adenine glycosylase